MPNCSTKESHSLLSAMADVGRPNARISPLSGSAAAVARLTKTSAVGRSNPTSIVAVPDGSLRLRTRSGLRPPYDFSTSVKTRGSDESAAIEQPVDFRDHLAAFRKRVDLDAQRAEIQRQTG